MARPPNPLCVQCAKLSRDAAIALHGAEGTGAKCWVAAANRCDKRRQYYGSAPVYNEVRKQRRRQQKGMSVPVTQLSGSASQLQGDYQTGQALPTAPRRSRSQRTETVTVPMFDVATPHAYVHWYRVSKDAPVHAIGAELWIGDQRRARASFHVTGGGTVQIKAQLRHVLDAFSDLAGVSVPHFRGEVERMPDCCPLRPCPLHPEL